MIAKILVSHLRIFLPGFVPTRKTYLGHDNHRQFTCVIHLSPQQCCPGVVMVHRSTRPGVERLVSIPDGSSDCRRRARRPRWRPIVTGRTLHCQSGYPVAGPRCHSYSSNFVAFQSVIYLITVPSSRRCSFRCGCGPQSPCPNVQHQHHTSSAWELDSSLCTFSSLFKYSTFTLDSIPRNAHKSHDPSYPPTIAFAFQPMDSHFATFPLVCLILSVPVIDAFWPMTRVKVRASPHSRYKLFSIPLWRRPST